MKDISASAHVTIREATRADAAEVACLIRNSTDKGSPITEKYVHEYVDCPRSRILLAEKHGRLVGLLSYSTRPDLWHAGLCCFIEEVIVEESERGRGVGTRLIQSVMDIMKRSGCAEIALSVGRENTAAQRLYRRLGIDEEALGLEKHF